jgi:outer membrane protein assembly factor BamB
MSMNEPTLRKPLRLWPGVALAVLLIVVRLVPIVVLEIMPIAMMGAVVGGLLILLWWLLFSRAPWSERLGVIVLMIVALFATSRLVHESIAGGAMGFLFYVWAIPALGVALVASVVATRRLSSRSRRASIAAAILLASGMWTLIRTEGVTSDLVGSDFRWRWTPTPEQRLLAQAADYPPSPAPAAETPKEPGAAKAADSPAAPAAPTADKAPALSEPGFRRVEGPATTPEPATTSAKAPALSDAGSKRVEGAAASDPVFRRPEWPGFRGPDRNGIVRSVRIETDWSKSPPVALWRRPIGPGWSSFAVDGDVLYTQEQRGEQEVVAAYKVSTGEPVWQHRDAVRFWESNGGAGPRGTPTLSHGRVYTFGATGILNALNAGNGAVIWSRNAATDTGVEVPDWGFASSPLVVGDLVVVAAAGRLVAYTAASGQQRWLGPTGGAGYSSPHLATLDGVDQILLLRGSRTISVAPADGVLLWEHKWEPGVGIVQPALVEGNSVLLSTGDAMGGVGMRRIDVSHKAAGWTVEERWTSRGLKPYYNDFVVHKGQAYGFDGSILACIDLADGNRKWKGGRYGSGQMVLLPDQDVLLVLSEEGDLAVVSATPDKFTEVARFKAIEGKTWNHPVLVGDVLLVRNGEEMAAFRLSPARRSTE